MAGPSMRLTEAVSSGSRWGREEEILLLGHEPRYPKLLDGQVIFPDNWRLKHYISQLLLFGWFVKSNKHHSLIYHPLWGTERKRKHGGEESAARTLRSRRSRGWHIIRRGWQHLACCLRHQEALGSSSKIRSMQVSIKNGRGRKFIYTFIRPVKIIWDYRKWTGLRTNLSVEACFC